MHRDCSLLGPCSETCTVPEQPELSVAAAGKPRAMVGAETQGQDLCLPSHLPAVACGFPFLGFSAVCGWWLASVQRPQGGTQNTRVRHREALGAAGICKGEHWWGWRADGGCFQQGLLQGPGLAPSCQSESRNRGHPALGWPGVRCLAWHPSGWSCLRLSPGLRYEWVH